MGRGSDRVKYLGVVASERMCFREHRVSIAAKINSGKEIEGWVGMLWESCTGFSSCQPALGRGYGIYCARMSMEE